MLLLYSWMLLETNVFLIAIFPFVLYCTAEKSLVTQCYLLCAFVTSISGGGKKKLYRLMSQQLQEKASS